jgi:hypothetical protein
LGNFSRPLKLATFRPAEAVSLDGATGKLRINGTDFRKRCRVAFHGEIAEAALGGLAGAWVRIWAGPIWP